ncbi:hypothetical protein YA53_00895, partial [Enterobacter kobei]
IPSLTSCNDTELTLRVSFRPQPEPTPDITDSEPDWSIETFINQASDSAMITLAMTSKMTAWKIHSLTLLFNSISICLGLRFPKAEVYQASFNSF